MAGAHDPKHVDCVGCHLGGLVPKFGQSDPSIAARFSSSPDLYVAPDGITGFILPSQLQNDLWQVHNFSYQARRPSIARRTVNETAELADFINTKMAWKNPSGKICTRAQIAAIWQCVFQQSSLAAPTIADCSKECSALAR